MRKGKHATIRAQIFDKMVGKWARSCAILNVVPTDRGVPHIDDLQDAITAPVELEPKASRLAGPGIGFFPEAGDPALISLAEQARHGIS